MSTMSTKRLTRRQLGTIAAALPALAQDTAPSANPANELEAARTQMRQNAAALRKFKISALVEPSVVFKA
jgi:hypothetical protein